MLQAALILTTKSKAQATTAILSNCRGGPVQNKTNVRLGWTKVLGADSYVIELFANDSLQFEGSPVTTYNEVTDNPYTITGLDGETKYSARIKAVGEKYPNLNGQEFSSKPMQSKFLKLLRTTISLLAPLL